MISKYKNFILFGTLIAASFITYWYFTKSDGGTSVEPVLGSDVATVAASNQVLILLGKLQAAAGKINNSLSNDPVFRSLRDGSVEIPPGLPGRTNPFEPLKASPTAQ